jgi:hypothetical protein
MPGYCIQHQKLGVKQMVPGWCGGTCASLGVCIASAAINTVHDKIRRRFFLFIPIPFASNRCACVD